MTSEIEYMLIRLEADFFDALDQIHDEALRQFRTLARSTGQRMRVK